MLYLLHKCLHWCWCQPVLWRHKVQCVAVISSNGSIKQTRVMFASIASPNPCWQEHFFLQRKKMKWLRPLSLSIFTLPCLFANSLQCLYVTLLSAEEVESWSCRMLLRLMVKDSDKCQKLIYCKQITALHCQLFGPWNPVSFEKRDQLVLCSFII